MAKGSLQIDLLGTSFAIQADESPDYLSTVYSKYRAMVAHIEKTASVKDPLKIAILAGILLADETTKEKAQRRDSPDKNDLAEVERLALGMISRIDQVL